MSNIEVGKVIIK